MLTWRDAEEAAELVQMEAFWAQAPVVGEDHLIDEIELEQTTLRRRLATALVQMGVRIDPSVADSLDPDAVA